MSMIDVVTKQAGEIAELKLMLNLQTKTADARLSELEAQADQLRVNVEQATRRLQSLEAKAAASQ